ncbi:hypothetical protein T265_06425 [Opisthorchis viverrini]|uniref:Uncharacterized protein n=1 Tax=Opisthorchis viverrini TaxID=6198 RepID=A0A074ZGH3_OPIVI|nr:hypothetical protein T265_06425 [Opisthorchis viverrini]KER26308.1 hypothetical protein T265_06425 [Opisthorchis viverrini]
MTANKCEAFDPETVASGTAKVMRSGKFAVWNKYSPSPNAAGPPPSLTGCADPSNQRERDSGPLQQRIIQGASGCRQHDDITQHIMYGRYGDFEWLREQKQYTPAKKVESDKVSQPINRHSERHGTKSIGLDTIHLSVYEFVIVCGPVRESLQDSNNKLLNPPTPDNKFRKIFHTIGIPFYAFKEGIYGLAELTAIVGLLIPQ